MASAFFRFFSGFCRLCNNALVSVSRSHPKARLWIADSVGRFCTQSGPNSHLSLTLTSFGLSGVATAQSVRLYIVASGKQFAKPCAFSNRVMTSKRDSGQFLKTLASTANWYFEFQDGKLDVRHGKEVGLSGSRSKSGKSNVCRVEIGSLNPVHEKQIATCWRIVYITTPRGMASASSATSLVATDTSRDD